MRVPFAARLAWREARGALRKTGVHALAISVGVASLVSVHGFRADAERSIAAQARSLLGADARLWRRDPISDSVRTVLDSLVAAGARVTTGVRVPSMILAPETGVARLFQVRGVDGDWPYYGSGAVDPPEWPPGNRLDGAFVDPAVLIQLGIQVGDSIRIGSSQVPVSGTVLEFPADMGMQSAIGPRVFVYQSVVEEAGLLGFGSLAQYEAFIATGAGDDASVILDRYRELLRGSATGYVTARQRAEDLTEGLRALSRFLGVVGLVALLLGGIGVASAVNVYVKSKIPAVAVLRCLGMTRGAILRSYLLQTAAVGTCGSLLGAGAGTAVQLLLPGLLGDLLPVTIAPRPSWAAVLLGVGVGLWTTVAFALGPLLPLRRVSPLVALRQDVEPGASTRDGWARATYLGVAATVVLLSVLEAPSVLSGLAIAAGLGLVVGSLWISARISTALLRRAFFAGARSYAVRQGLANLHRPRNQTVPVVLALGFGVFVIASLSEVQRNIADGLSLDSRPGAANVLLFDIQADQKQDVEDLVGRFTRGAPQSTPLIPSRILELDGRRASDVLSDSLPDGPERWAVRRQYRSSYRTRLGGGEELVAGTWWRDGASDGDRLPGISLEMDLAEALGVDLGSRVTWSLGGQELETEVRSLRRVDWARFEPNFFVLFEPGTADEAPHTWMTLAHVPEAEARALLQRDVALGFTNVSVLDLARVQETIDSLIGMVRRVLIFLSVFATLAGVLVLSGAVAVTRGQRMREAALLKTLGARRNLVFRILVIEYVALGGLAFSGALLLALLASWGLVVWLFEMPFHVHLGSALALALGVTLLAVTAGLGGSRGILARPPLALLRETRE